MWFLQRWNYKQMCQCLVVVVKPDIMKDGGCCKCVSTHPMLNHVKKSHKRQFLMCYLADCAVKAEPSVDVCYVVRSNRIDLAWRLLLITSDGLCVCMQFFACGYLLC